MNFKDELNFDHWIDEARSDRLEDRDIARLAETLAASGERLKRRDASADLASTGGPGSLSTLWGPAALVAHDVTVAKLGVPGRPAGGVDVLMQIEGYRTDHDAVGAEKIIDQCGYAHLLAGARFAPADAAMFSYRQHLKAQNIPALAIASLLSKKLATGTALAGLEVRVALELLATLAGRELFRRCGYEEHDSFSEIRRGIEIPLVRMSKRFPPRSALRMKPASAATRRGIGAAAAPRPAS